jgi:AP-4 complex subunit epsilon-1
VKLLKLLAVLGKGDRAASELMYGVLTEALRAADNGTNIGNAIISEAVKTVAGIHPNQALLLPAADAVARFLRAKSNNLKAREAMRHAP